MLSEQDKDRILTAMLENYEDIMTDLLPENFEPNYDDWLLYDFGIGLDDQGEIEYYEGSFTIDSYLGDLSITFQELDPTTVLECFKQWFMDVTSLFTIDRLVSHWVEVDA